MEATTTVSWKTYAQKYDMLLTYNPFYQQLHKQVMTYLQKWNLPEGTVLADVGAGTGNYSLAMARLFPQSTILHFDKDDGMNLQAASKREHTLTNHQIHQVDVDQIALAPDSLDGLISIHALYTFADPQAVLERMYGWLKPGSSAILVNAGRIVNLLSWQWSIGWHLLANYGLQKTWEIMREGREVSRQNGYIRDMQRKGVYWTHSHQEFCQAVEKAGFEIRTAKKTFRGISDLVVAQKR